MGLVSAKYPTSIWNGVAGDRVDRYQDAGPSPKDYDTLVAEILGIETEHYNRDHWTYTNDNAGTVNAGMAVYLKSNGNVDKANAAAVGTSHVIGLAEADVAAAASGSFKRNGTLTLTTAQWDTAAGTTGGLTPGTAYFLSDSTAGKLTATAPTTATHTSLRCGIALSSTQLLLSCSDQPRLL